MQATLIQEITQYVPNKFIPYIKAINEDSKEIKEENIEKFKNELDILFSSDKQNIIKSTIILLLLQALANKFQTFPTNKQKETSIIYLLNILEYIHLRIQETKIFSYINHSAWILEDLNFKSRMKNTFSKLLEISSLFDNNSQVNFPIASLICQIIYSILKSIQDIILLRDILYEQNFFSAIYINREIQEIQEKDIKDYKTYVNATLAKLLKEILYKIRTHIIPSYKTDKITLNTAIGEILEDVISGDLKEEKIVDYSSFIQITYPTSASNTLPTAKTIEYRNYNNPVLGSDNEFLVIKELQEILIYHRKNLKTQRKEQDQPDYLYRLLNKKLKELLMDENFINKKFGNREDYFSLLIQVIVLFEDKYQHVYNLDEPLSKNYIQIKKIQTWIQISNQLSKNVRNASQSSKVCALTRNTLFSFNKGKKSKFLSRIAAFLQENIGSLSARAIKRNQEEETLNLIYTIIKFAAHKKRNPFGFFSPPHSSKELQALMTQAGIDKNALTNIDLDEKIKENLYNAKSKKAFDKEMHELLGYLFLEDKPQLNP